MARNALAPNLRHGSHRPVAASDNGGFPNSGFGPNLSRIVRNAHCTVRVVRD